jgi:glutathione S-transferase
MMKLYIFPPSPRAVRVVALANYAGLKPRIHALDYFNAEQHDPEFAAINPNRRMPVLVDENFVLWESNAILQYLAQKVPERNLWPRDARAQADVLRWQFWGTGHWEEAWGILINERFKRPALDSRDSGKRTFGRATTPGVPDPNRIAEGERYANELLDLLNNHLEGRNWLCECGLSIAEFSIASFLGPARGMNFPLARFANVMRWLSSVEQLPGWQDAQPKMP